MDISSGYSHSHRESSRNGCFSGRAAGTGGAERMSQYLMSLDALITSDEKSKERELQQVCTLKVLRDSSNS